ncbi:MAG TPA: phosphotransferase, partial [Gaiellaceae bacterium]|nr:phosphotransferase [Gaiellaceae bacterium]
AVEAVASWLVDVARETAGPAGTLAAERRRLAEVVLPRWAGFGAPGDLVERVPPLPGVLQHNDLGSWNVVVGRRGFVAVDWESARERGFPLWDVWYFLADALAHLDGATTPAARSEHFLRLFAGELPSSHVLLGWTRRAAEAAGVPSDALGALATLCWLGHGAADLARRAAAPRGGTEAGGTFSVERLARLWLSHPALGPRWRAGNG